MQYYRLLTANPYYSDSFVLRAAIDPVALVPRLQRIVAILDPEEPIGAPQMMDHILNSVTLQRRFATALLSGLGGMALLLTALGLFSVVSVSVADRTRVRHPSRFGRNGCQQTRRSVKREQEHAVSDSWRRRWPLFR